MIPVIKFSHFYTKIGLAFNAARPNDIESHATLIEVLDVKLEDLSEEFLAYDTTFLHLEARNTKNDPLLGMYPLPKKGDYLLLIFLGSKGVFTTLRRKNDEKRAYYRGKIGVNFILEFTTEQWKVNPRMTGDYGMSLFDKPFDNLKHNATA